MYASVQISQCQAETYISELKPFELNEIGTKQWFRQHERLEKLNIQAAKNAAIMENEFIKDLFVSDDKVPVLVHNIVTTEIWRKYLFPIIINKLEVEATTTFGFPLSIMLHHLVTVVGLMETLLFHSELCENVGDYLTDLVDFCHRQLVILIDGHYDGDFEVKFSTSSEGASDRSEKAELEIQAQKIDFQIGIKSITILGYVIEHMQDLPLGIRTRLLCCHDIPMVFVQLLESPPWIRKTIDNNTLKYDGSKWTILEEQFKVDKIDGQVWIALFRLIHDEDNIRKYHMTDFRKGRLLKLRPLLHHMLLDQMPYLEPLRRTLEELSIFDPPPAKKDLIIEQTSVIWDSVHQKWGDKWESLAHHQMKSVFNYSQKDIQEQAKLLCGLYIFDDIVEDLAEQFPKCGFCGKSASKKCSKCKRVWYCQKNCQVDHWPLHKLSCN